MNRNQSIDLVKVVAAIGVVFIHVTAYHKDIFPLTGNSEFFYYALRFAVPFFFLCSGYFVSNKQRAFYSTTKLYIFFMVVYNILRPLNIYLFDSRTTNVAWYLLAYATILLLTYNENKYWLTFLFTLSFLLNTLDGHVIRSLNLELFKGNSAITFMYVYIFGRYLRTLNIYIKPVYGKTLVLLSIVFMFLNGYILHYDQFEIFSILTAIIIFIGAKDLHFNTKINLATLSLDIYIFHSFFAPLKLLLPNQYQYTIIPITILSSILAIYTAKLFRFISTKYFNGELYS